MIAARYPRAYLAFDALLALAGQSIPGAAEEKEFRSLRRLWEAFQDSRISLAAEADETEIEIILWLNRQGCCVFDTLMVMEAIEEYENWGQTEPDEIDRFKRAFDYFEQLELFSAQRTAGGLTKDRGAVAEALRAQLFGDFLLTEAKEDDAEPVRLLRQCLGALHERYSTAQWQNLRAVEYGLNWDIIGPHLTGDGTLDAFGKTTGCKAREVFGLFCRSVALSKKSCPTPHMTESHINFVIDTVMKKYRYEKGDRYTVHLLSCGEQGIPYFITVDPGLLAAAVARAHVFEVYRTFFPAGLRILCPTAFESLL